MLDPQYGFLCNQAGAFFNRCIISFLMPDPPGIFTKDTFRIKRDC
jgi:hypothetical protein